jgi:hypothetical protein
MSDNRSQSTAETRGLAVLDHLLACGGMLSTQLPSASDWSAEKRLAGAVLMAALVEVRDRHAHPAYRRRVAQDMEWIQSDDVDWPFSFVRLCQLFELDPAWVRGVVARWRQAPHSAPHRQSTKYCHAA